MRSVQDDRDSGVCQAWNVYGMLMGCVWNAHEMSMVCI